jgi:hypothetical protein
MRCPAPRRRLARVLALGLILALSSAGPMALLAGSPTDTRGAVTYVARDYGFSGPERIPAGLTTVEIINHGQDAHQIQFIKLPAGKTAADFSAEIIADPARLPSWTQRRGGPNGVVPGERATAIIDLEPGDYVLICGIPDRHGVPHVALGMLKPLRVVAAAERTLKAPQADLTITLVDFAFELSRPVTAGEKTIHVLNKGTQPHEVVVVQLAPGASIKDFAESFVPGVPVLPAGKPIGGIVGLERGLEGFFRMDFPPGIYGLICFLPDITRGAPHFTRGMMMDIMVQ